MNIRRPSPAILLVCLLIAGIFAGCSEPLSRAQLDPHRSPLPPAQPGAAAPKGEGKSSAGGEKPQQPPTQMTETGKPYPIDLPTALRLASAQNTQIAIVRERINESLARLDQARLLLLPTLNVGASYNKHEGNLQDTQGRILESSRGAAYAGLGSGASGASGVAVPGLTIRSDLAEAIFAPLAARQGWRASEARGRAVQNQVLLAVALAYQDLLGAKANLTIAEEALRNASALARLTEDYSRAGEGLQSDAERATVERLLREKSVEEAREELRVRSVQLAELLRLEAQVELDPIEPAVAPITLVPEGGALAELVDRALNNRPEAEASRALIEKSRQLLSQARLAPLIPNLSVNWSWGGFGGGDGGHLGDFRDRTDFDALLFWELRNLGAGDWAFSRERSAQYGEAQAIDLSVRDRIGSEVSIAHSQISSRRKQIALAAAAVESALRSFNSNQARIQGKQGIPIEALQSIQALALSRKEYLNAVLGYNQAQFQLHTALGQPVEASQEEKKAKN